MAQIVLVTGGARSGKSAYAEQRAAKNGKRIAYIATAQILDEEMCYRVKLHRARRPKNWDTYEAPEHAEHAIQLAGKTHDFILFDCITVYLSNVLCALPKETWRDTDTCYRLASRAIDRLIEAAQGLQNVEIVFVTNEVGAGIVPENQLARLYRDLAGLMNQKMAHAADEVIAVLCGIPLKIKDSKHEAQEGYGSV